MASAERVPQNQVAADAAAADAGTEAPVSSSASAAAQAATMKDTVVPAADAATATGETARNRVPDWLCELYEHLMRSQQRSPIGQQQEPSPIRSVGNSSGDRVGSTEGDVFGRVVLLHLRLRDAVLGGDLPAARAALVDGANVNFRLSVDDSAAAAAVDERNGLRGIAKDRLRSTPAQRPTLLDEAVAAGQVELAALLTVWGGVVSDGHGAALVCGSCSQRLPQRASLLSSSNSGGLCPLCRRRCCASCLVGGGCRPCTAAFAAMTSELTGDPSAVVGRYRSFLERLTRHVPPSAVEVDLVRILLRLHSASIASIAGVATSYLRRVIEHGGRADSMVVLADSGFMIDHLTALPDAAAERLLRTMLKTGDLTTLCTQSSRFLTYMLEHAAPAVSGCSGSLQPAAGVDSPAGSAATASMVDPLRLAVSECLVKIALHDPVRRALLRHPVGVRTMLELAASDSNSYQFVVGTELTSAAAKEVVDSQTEVLGKGSFGVVFKSRLRNNDVAVKRMSPSTDQDRRNVRREIAVLSLFAKEPGLLGCRGYFESKGEVYLVCDFAALGNVQSVFTKRSLTWSEKHKVAVDLANGLKLLHDCGVVHRDIKPDNCLVTADYAGQLADFGSVRIRTSNGTLATFAGTDWYRPPELLATPQYQEPCLVKHDVFSFGCVLYELWTGTRIHSDCKTNFEVQAKYARGETVNVPKDCSWKHVIESCLRLEPAGRPTSADILLDLLALYPHRIIGNKGRGSCEFEHPYGVALTPSGQLVVADYGNYRIQVLELDGTFVRQWGSKGNEPGQFNEIRAVAVAPDGSVYVTDVVNSRVQVFDERGNYLRTLADDVGQPSSIALDPIRGRCFVSSWLDNCVHCCDLDGGRLSTIGSRRYGDGCFRGPSGMCVDGAGNLFVCDQENHRVQVFDADGRFLRKFGTEGDDDGMLTNPRWIALSPVMSMLAVSDDYGVQLFTPSGEFVRRIGLCGLGTVPGEFTWPQGPAFTPDGRLVVCDLGNHRLQIFSVSPMAPTTR